MNKKSLAVALSRLRPLLNYERNIEQYSIDSENAAMILWDAYLHGDIKGDAVDLGCGNGILGIGSLLLGASKCYFVDIDSNAIKIARENLDRLNLNGEFFIQDVSSFNKKCHIVFMNPPFGVQRIHADKAFLEQAFKISKIVYSIHKIESIGFLRQISKDNGFKMLRVIEFDFIIKRVMKSHKKEKYIVKVGCFVFHKVEKRKL